MNRWWVGISSFSLWSQLIHPSEILCSGLCRTSCFGCYYRPNGTRTPIRSALHYKRVRGVHSSFLFIVLNPAKLLLRSRRAKLQNNPCLMTTHVISAPITKQMRLPSRKLSTVHSLQKKNGKRCLGTTVLQFSSRRRILSVGNIDTRFWLLRFWDKERMYGKLRSMPQQR